jgi:Rieske Fe-S protein
MAGSHDINGCNQHRSRMLPRRSVLKLGLAGVGLTGISPVALSAQGDVASTPPQAGDLLVKIGDPASRPLGPADVTTAGRPLAAWPMDPVSRTVRDGTRLNEILLIRLNPAAPGDKQSNALEGVLAYSGLCPHAGCNVTGWIPEKGILSCDCHSSEFDAKADGRVVGGPASRALPPLILKMDGGVFVIAKPFATAIRFDEQEPDL